MKKLQKDWFLWDKIRSQESIDSAVELLREIFNFEKHPYFVWAWDEKRKRQEFLESQIPFRFAVESFSQALAAVLAHIPHLESRLHLAENVAEEHGHNKIIDSHKFTFLQYLRALGAEPEQLFMNCPIGVRAFTNSLQGYCMTNPYYSGAALLGIIEYQYIFISGMIGQNILSKDWVKPGAQRHYEFHEVLDVEHAKELFDIADVGWTHEITRNETALGLCLGAKYFWDLYCELLP